MKFLKSSVSLPYPRFHVKILSLLQFPSIGRGRRTEKAPRSHNQSLEPQDLHGEVSVSCNFSELQDSIFDLLQVRIQWEFQEDEPSNNENGTHLFEGSGD